MRLWNGYSLLHLLVPMAVPGLDITASGANHAKAGHAQNECLFYRHGYHVTCLCIMVCLHTLCCTMARVRSYSMPGTCFTCPTCLPKFGKYNMLYVRSSLRYCCLPCTMHMILHALFVNGSPRVFGKQGSLALVKQRSKNHPIGYSESRTCHCQCQLSAWVTARFFAGWLRLLSLLQICS